MSQRILVIDHHPQGLQRVVDPLREAGYEVAVAQTVADGAAAFGRFRPALVFIAARLPRTHGTVLCRELKRTDAGASTPIVLIVESTGIQIDLPPLDQFGADRLIQKPVSSDELLVICRELLERACKPAASDDNETDDGLTIAPEELDLLEFDLPDKVVRGPRNTPQSPTVPLSNDRGEDIENHLEDLFTEKQRLAPAPTTAPKLSTGRDNDADAAVIDELDLENELNAKLGAKEEANPSQPVQGSTTRRRTAVPPAPSATTTKSKPLHGSVRMVGRYQTEAFTRERNVPQPFPEATDTKHVVGLARWSWVAIPVTVAVVFLAVFFMSRSQETQPDTGFTTTPYANGELDGTRFSLVADSVVEADPPNLAIEPGEEGLPEVAAQKQASQNAKPETDPPSAVAEREPETPDPVSRESAPRIVTQEPLIPDSATRDVLSDRESNDPEPRIVVQESEPQIQEVEDIPEPVVEAKTPDPEPTAFDDPAPLEVAHDPITRDPVLIQRIEPRVSKRDLRKGGGTIVLRVRISESGNVTRVLVDQGLPGSPLEGAAVTAVLRWRYEPALDRDEPVEAWTTARFTFD